MMTPGRGSAPTSGTQERSCRLGLVSVGLPVHNGMPHVERAIRSLLGQDYAHTEIIISDNASDDGTSQVCRRFAEENEAVTLLTNEVRSEAVDNFKKVLDAAHGEYFMWAASDDDWDSRFISVLAAELESRPQVGVVMSAVRTENELGAPIDEHRFSGSDDPNTKSFAGMLKAVTSQKKYNFYIYGLFRTDLLREAVRYLPSVPGQDRILLAQLSLATRFGYVDEVLHVRTVHTVPYHLRRPDESIARMGARDRLVFVRMLAWMAIGVFGSSLIPWYRKPLGLVAAERYGRALLTSRLSQRAVRHKDRLPPWLFGFLKRVKDAFTPK